MPPSVAGEEVSGAAPLSLKRGGQESGISPLSCAGSSYGIILDITLLPDVIICIFCSSLGCFFVLLVVSSFGQTLFSVVYFQFMFFSGCPCPKETYPKKDTAESHVQEFTAADFSRAFTVLGRRVLPCLAPLHSADFFKKQIKGLW